MKSAFIYLIAAGRDIIKVGVSEDIRKRTRALQTATPFDLHLVHRVEVAPSHALKLEKLIHKRMKRYHMRGEWFRVERSVAIRIADEAARVLRGHTEAAFSSEIAAELCPGTVTRHVYCPDCFHKGTAIVPLGVMPAFKCSECGCNKPLVGGRDPIRPWLQARREKHKQHRMHASAR